MRVASRHFRLFVLLTLFTTLAFSQATFTALVRGTVTDATSAVVPGARVSITADATGVSETTNTNEVGRYLFPSLSPTTYTIRVEASGFRAVVRPNVTLRVGAQHDLDFTLEVGEVTASMEVRADAPLLNSVSAALGTEVTNRYIIDMPLLNRSIVNLSYIAPGVTEVPGSGITEWGGTNFVSNGQRNGTAEIRLDGTLTTIPEGGEGGNTVARYQPSLEAVQEFKLQNNSFSAEFGNNGGTVINMVSKSGANEFHGAGWWFFRRPEFDANTFYANRNNLKKADYKRDLYGGNVGGPILKQKTFFFFNYERLRNVAPSTVTATVPTALQKAGDYSQTFNRNGTLQQIFDPFDIYITAGEVRRRAFPDNKIPASRLDSIGYKTAQLYAAPTGAGDPMTQFNNYNVNLATSSPTYRSDIKVDHNFSERLRMFGRFSFQRSDSQAARIFLSGYDSFTNEKNAIVEVNWARRPTDLLTVRAGINRDYHRSQNEEYDPAQVGFPSVLTNVHGLKRFVRITAEDYRALASGCCNDRVRASIQPVLAGSYSKFVGQHNIKFGGEGRTFQNNFWEPDDPTGRINFTRNITMERVLTPNSNQGNAMASLLLGWPGSGRLGGQPPTATLSGEFGFFLQDDWNITKKLTINLGLRYEWNQPYTERFDRLQMVDYYGDTGIDLPGLGRLRGITRFAGEDDQRTAGADRNNLAPRLGFAYRLNDKTVLRGGAGVYYGLNFATNWQYVGPSFYKNATILFTKDDHVTRYASLANPFPDGFVRGEGKQYGKLTQWGYGYNSNIDDEFHSAEIYQWNAGVQRELPGGTLVEVNYSASRSNHLPWGGARNRNFISTALREQYGTAGLSQRVANPFQPMFVGPNAIFSKPDSIYIDPTIPRRNLLRPYPQFPGSFAGFPIFAANASYHSMQIRFEKRYSHGLNFVGHYTFSKLNDNTSLGSNPWLLTDFAPGSVQDLNDRRPEWGVGLSDTPQRFVIAASYDLPFGKGKHFLSGASRPLDYLVGGWKLNSFVTLQSGVPTSVNMGFARLQDGSQRPNRIGDPTGSSLRDVVDNRGIYFNEKAFADPGDQKAGNSPRYLDQLRNDGIGNWDFSVHKNFQIREQMRAEFHADFFNFTNTPRFGRPAPGFGSASFGQINSTANSPRQGQLGVRFIF